MVGPALALQHHIYCKASKGARVLKGSKSEKRPAEVIEKAVRVMRIATGDIKEDADPNDAMRAAGSVQSGATRASAPHR
jgi:hypothetical protein